MPIIAGILLLIIVLLVGGAILGVALNLLWYLLVGLVIGALARLVVPNTAGMSLIATSLFGIAGALLGGMVANEVLGLGRLGSLLASVAVAALLLAAFAGVASRDRRKRT